MSTADSSAPGDQGPDADSYRYFPMPDLIREHASAWLVAPPEQPSPAKPSATVLLLREPATGAAGPEVFALRRASTMPFAPDVIAFPGGGVDPRDADTDVPWAGPEPATWATVLHTGEDAARELVIAAAREVFEECGVLLAGSDAHTVVEDLTEPAWDREREALLSREQSFGELLIRRGLVLRSDLLQLRAHWITPECEPRRYDTRFFAARMPRGQRADDRSTEVTRAVWVSPARTLQDADTGREILLPPTRHMLEQLTEVDSVLDYFAAAPEVWPVQPRPVERDDGLWMRAPLGPTGHGMPPQP